MKRIKLKQPTTNNKDLSSLIMMIMELEQERERECKRKIFVSRSKRFWSFFFKKMDQPRPLFHFIFVFPNTQCNFYN